VFSSRCALGDTLVGFGARDVYRMRQARAH
jgi:hypothetical protein